MSLASLCRSRLPALVCAAAACLLAACDQREPDAPAAPPSMRRLTEDQYRNIIFDIFGPTIAFGARFDPLPRSDGLIALSARTAVITPAGFEQYYVVARSIAAQVTDEVHREVLVPCRPAATTTADDVCATTFFAKVGRLLYRRPLADSELTVAVNAAQNVAASSGDFYQGLGYGLAGLLTSPKFLFITDTVEPNPAAAGATRLTAYAKASRLSFLLWNSAPDDALLTAAERGEVDNADGLERQVARMMQSARLETGIRSFFADFLDLQRFETLEKDAVIYPAFNVRAGEEAREQLMRVVVDHTIDRDLDYRGLFTTRQTFLTPRLAVIYRVPTSRPSGGWTPYEFPAGGMRAGIATTIGFLAVHSHPGKSSPTLRGRAIRETLLCQKVPDPPAEVDFSLFNDPDTHAKTTRERLTAHRTAETCAGCHKMTDPIGLALENFDGAGIVRTTDNGELIDPSGEIDGVAFGGAAELGQALHDHPAAPACLVNRLYAYALGRPVAPGDRKVVDYFQQRFAADGYKVTRLLQRIALSEVFYKVSEPGGGRL